MLKTNLLGLCLLVATTTVAVAEDQNKGQFKASLNGYNEVPSVLSTGTGQVTLTVSSDQKSLSVTLTFTQLFGVAQTAGLYLGDPATTGGLIAPLCGGTKAACPTTAGGTVTVTIAATDIAAIAAQGLVAGDIASVIQAIANGAVYVNVLTNKFVNGEIRGQLGRGFGIGQGLGGGREN